MEHKHHWILDEVGFGRCSCGAEKQFDNVGPPYLSFMPPHIPHYSIQPDKWIEENAWDDAIKTLEQ